MPAKKKSEVASVKKELRCQWVLWYRGSICAELKKKPRSQSELFIGLARRDGRPNPQTRCHPSLMPPPAATALEELIREKVVERERSERLIMFRLAGKPVPLVKKPRLELRRSPAPHTATAANKVVRPERGKDRSANEITKSFRKLVKKFASLETQIDLLSQTVRVLGRERGRGGDAYGKLSRKFSRKIVSLDVQVRKLSRQVKVSEKERARRDDVVGRTVQALGSKFSSLEGRVIDSENAKGSSGGVSSRLADLEQRLGVFEEQVGRVARSVKAVIAEPRPAVSEAGGGD